MQTMRFLIGKQGGQVKVRGQTHTFSPHSLVVTSSDAVVCHGDMHGDVQCFDFSAADLHNLYPEVIDLLDTTPQELFWREPVRSIKAEKEVLVVIEGLADAHMALLRFTYVYCLGIDRRYFSELLRHVMTGDNSFLDFVERNYLNQWSVARFAEEFNMPLRKFSNLFQQKYGTSAKQWLLERRLMRARDLLLSTSMRVLDIALECGFSNHGHFTDSFRKRFFLNPTQFRLQNVGPCSDPHSLQGETHGYQQHQ